jgi:predicted nucleic-acid-binding Zn-ribbon protein
MSSRRVSGPVCPTCGQENKDEAYHIVTCDNCGLEEVADPPWVSHMENGHDVFDACSASCFKVLMTKWIAVKDAERAGPVGGVEQ